MPTAPPPSPPRDAPPAQRTPPAPRPGAPSRRIAPSRPAGSPAAGSPAVRAFREEMKRRPTQANAKPPRSWRSRLRNRVLGIASLTFAATVLFGLLLRLTLRDGFAPLAPAFYALSVPVLVVLGLAATLTGVMSFGVRLTVKRSLALVALGLLAAVNGAIFLYQDSTFDDRPRVVLWNVARGAVGWDGVVEGVEANHPTLAVLIESGPNEEQTDGGTNAFWQQRFGDQYFIARPGAVVGTGITILSRGPIGRVEFERLPGGGYVATVDTKLGGERVTVLAVDILSNPRLDRGPALRRVAELAAESSARRPTLVAGDFNTPPGSVHFGALRRAGFEHAFEEHGAGYAATWPLPAPVLHLDHVWLSAGFDVGEASHGWTAASDHRPALVPTRVSMKRFEAARESRNESPTP